jgi:hypothetical protein
MQHAALPPEPPPDPEESGLYVPWWGFALVILAVAAITCGMWWLVLSNRGAVANGEGPTPTPIFVVITSTPTLGPAEGGPTQPPPSPTATPLAGSTPTDTPTPDVTRVPIQIGDRVMVSGTEGFGLKIRQGPGLSYDMVFLGLDDETFTVGDGPRQSDGYTWWYIVDPSDANRFGWAVEDYLVVQP